MKMDFKKIYAISQASIILLFLVFMILPGLTAVGNAYKTDYTYITCGLKKSYSFYSLIFGTGKGFGFSLTGFVFLIMVLGAVLCSALKVFIDRRYNKRLNILMIVFLGIVLWMLFFYDTATMVTYNCNNNSWADISSDYRLGAGGIIMLVFSILNIVASSLELSLFKNK